MPEAVIVSSVRTPVGRGYKGSLRTTRPDDLAALVIKEALARVPGLNPKEIDDVILGQKYAQWPPDWGDGTGNNSRGLFDGVRRRQPGDDGIEQF